MSSHNYDVLVVGSGFGGSVAALRLAEKGYRVGVLEAGRRWNAEDFPRTNWNVRKYLWAPRLGCRGIQRITLLRNLLVLSGAGVGGGSLVYANVLYEPPDAPEELKPFYETARRMLGATPTPFTTPADELVREVATQLGAGESFEPTPVGVWFGEDGVDPYFGGGGPLRNGCVRCGGCMVGCRHGAKNTLDRNYLYLAERLGATILPEHEATRLRRDGSDWLVETRRGTFRAPDVVLAAGALGTTKLLLRSGVGGPHVGENVRTNSEALVGATAPDVRVDHSRGIAIGSSVRVGDTHLQPVRYPKGSNLMSLLAKPLRVRRWSERTVILLAMQSEPSALRARLKRGRLTTETTARPVPTHLPVATRAAALAAELLGGVAGRARLNVPTTAHVLGGACVGTVLDDRHRVITDPGLHVVDGAAVDANLGVNPSLTIAARAERAMSFWPRRRVDPAV